MARVIELVRFVPIADISVLASPSQLPAINCHLLPRNSPTGCKPMPTYQYRCEECGKKFERTETISEHEADQTTHSVQVRNKLISGHGSFNGSVFGLRRTRPQSVISGQE